MNVLVKSESKIFKLLDTIRVCSNQDASRQVLFKLKESKF